MAASRLSTSCAPFGCLAYMKKQGHLRKLDDRSTPVVFIGYEDGVKAYRLLDPVTRRVSIVRDVIFDEDRSWSWTSTMDSNTADSGSSEFQVKYNYTAPFPAPTPSPTSSPVPATASPATPAPSSIVSSDGEDSPFELEHVTPLENDEERFDAAHRGDSPVRYCTIEGVIGAGQPVPGLAQRNLEGELNMISASEPRTFAEAEQEEAWRAAMRNEVDSIKQNQTWELIDLPQGQRPITLKWVFKLKKGETGEVVKHKARLVAHGFIQQAGVDFDEVFAPVARMESVRLLLALAVEAGWNVHHMDVKSAFLNGDLKEEVYVC
jgi:hypothetical protein